MSTPQKKADKSAAPFAIGGADGGSNPRPKTVRFQIIGQQQTFVNNTLQAFQHIRQTMFGFVRSALFPQNADNPGWIFAQRKADALSIAHLMVCSNPRHHKIFRSQPQQDRTTIETLEYREGKSNA